MTEAAEASDLTYFALAATAASPPVRETPRQAPGAGAANHGRR